MKRILTREQYLDTIRQQNYTKYTGVGKTNEALANEVNWGDSLVGRLINSIARKVKIKFNLKRISSLSARLESLLDEIVERGKIDMPYGVTEFLTSSYMLGELEDSVEKEEDVEKLINILLTLEGQVNSYNLEDKDELLRILKEFREFLENLSKPEEDKDDDVEEKEEGSEINVEILFNNLELLKELLSMISKITPTSPQKTTPPVGDSTEIGKGGGFKEEEIKPDKLAIYKNDKNQIIPKTIVDQTGVEPDSIKIDTPKFEAITGLKKNIQNIVPYVKKGSKISFMSGGKKIVGEIIFINKDTDKVKVKRDDNGQIIQFRMRDTDFKKESFIFEDVEPTDPKKELLLKKLKGSANILIDPKDKGLAINIKWIDEILSLKEDPKVRELIKGLYRTIQSYIVGDKRNTLNPNTKGLFESFVDEYKLDTKYGYGVGKTQIAAEKIARFYYFCLKFTGEPEKLTSGDAGGYKLLGDLGNKLKELNNSTTNILKTKFKEKEVQSYKVGDVVKYKKDDGTEGEKKITKIEGDFFYFDGSDGKEYKKSVSDIISKVEKKAESIIKQYDKFLKIFEKTSGVDYGSIEAKFEELFTEEIMEKFFVPDGVEKSFGKASDVFLLKDADPIIEIVRLFQRAWRLHTRATIPSGRTGGKVSDSVYNEYEYVGAGSPGDPEKPGYGPWRNIELFDKWNDAVFNLLKDTKYTTTVFSDDAKFVWNYEDRFKGAKISGNIFKEYKGDEAGPEQAKPLGKILLRFITNLTNDSSMYSAKGEGNNLQKFLNEYFGLGSEDLKKLGGLSYYDDAKKNSDVVENIEKPKVCKFEKVGNVEETKRGLSTFIINSGTKGIVLKLKFNDKIEYFYFLGVSRNKNTYYFLNFDKIYFQSTLIIEGLRNQTPQNLNIISIGKGDLRDLKPEGNLKSNFWEVKQDFDENKKTKEFEIREISILVDKESKEVYTGASLDLIKRKFNTIVQNLRKVDNKISL